jgi:HAMP domain-containing protein
MYTAVMQTLVNQFHGESLALIQHAITAKLFVRSLLLIFAIAVISVFISHRIAGPVYKFERILEALAAGEKVQEITLRKHDEFYRLARAINSLIRARK